LGQEEKDVSGKQQRMPRWLKTLIESVCDGCLCGGQGRMSGFYLRWAEPSNNDWETWLIDIAPTKVELVGGADDGEMVFDPVHVDLLALAQVLTRTSLFLFHSACSQGDRAHFVLGGRQGKRQLAIRIWLEPFEDEEPSLVYDVREKCWRPKRR
jgi:hypothetical protein